MKKNTQLKEINKHITELIEQSYNIDVSKYDGSFLNKSLQKRITVTHYGSTKTYCTLLQQNNMGNRVGNNKTFTIKLTCIIHQLCKNANIIQVNPDIDSVVFEFWLRDLGQKLTES
jgi:hypothetical protein